jgi:hypothetical protein
VAVLRWLTFGVLAVVVIAMGVAVLARFSGGPIGPFPGGRLSGTPASGAVGDWTPVLSGVPRIEIEVNPVRPRSVTTSYLVHDGKLYVPSMMAAHKSWPQAAIADDRVVVRVAGKLYERRAVRVTEPAEIRALVRAWDASAPDDMDVSALSTWYFRMDPRSSP